MDLGSNSNTLSLTGGDNNDAISDTLINLSTITSNNQTLINNNTILINDVSGSLNTLNIQVQDLSGSLDTLNIQVQDLSGVVDENIFFMNDVSYNLNTLNIQVQDLSGVVQDLSGVVQDLSGVVDTKVSKSGDTMTGDLIVDNIKIGSGGSNNAYIAHKDRFTSGQHSLVQTSTGATFINGYNQSGENYAYTYFRANGTTIMSVNGDGLTMVGNNEITYKGQTLDDRFHPSGDYALDSVLVDLSTNFYVLQNTTIQDLSGRILTNTDDITDISGSLTTLENVVIDLCGNVATNISTIADISGLVQVNIADISSHNTRITDVEDTLQDLQDELDNIDDDGQGGSVFDAIFGTGTAVSLATIASLAYQAYTIAVAATASATTANSTNATQAIEIEALEQSRQINLVNTAFPVPLTQTNEAGIYNITSSGLIDANEITATDISATTISADGFTSATGYGTGNTQITPAYTDIYSSTTTISGETINITGNTAVNVNGNINLNGNNITGVNVLSFSGSSIDGLDTLNFKTATGSNASISNLKSVAGDNFTIQADGDAIFGSKTISTLQTASQVGTLITTAINALVGNAGTGYDTLVELQNEIENNDVSLNEVFTNVATKVSKSGDTMTGNLTINRTTDATNLTIAGNSNWEGAKITLNNLSTTSSKLPYIDFTNQGLRYAYLGYGNAVNGGTDNHIDLVLQRGSYFKIVTGDLKVDNPNEIYYKNQTLDDRFLSIVDGSVTTPKLADLAVTTPKIANYAVTADKLGGNSVIEAKLGNGAVTAFKIGTEAVISSKIGVGAVIEAKLGTGAVTETKISSGAVTDDKLANPKLNISGGVLTGDLTISKPDPSTENAQLVILCNGSYTGGNPNLYSQVYVGESSSFGTYYRYEEDDNVITLGNNNNNTEIDMISWNRSGLDFTIHKDTEITANLNVGGNTTIDGTTTFNNNTSFQGALNTFTDDVAIGGEVSAGSADITANLVVGGDANITGDIDVTGNATINNARVGVWSGSSTFACFSHDTKNTTTGYALLQSSNGATYLNANSGNELSIRQGNSPRIDIAGNGDVSIANNLSVGVDMSVAGKYEVGSTPLITQVHSFIQTDLNPLNRYRFFTHSPNLDSNNNNPVFGIKSVGRIIPYALVMACDGDGETATDFTFQIRARTDTSNIANLTTGTTSVRGTATINDIEENQTKKVLFTGTSTIFDDQSWGLYLSNMNPDGFDGEIIVKVYFYQVA
jgi:hypothetical protein